MCKIGVIDIGIGNLRSVYNALTTVGADVEVSRKVKELNECEKLVFPGVGSFGSVMEALRTYDLDAYLTTRANNGDYILGICVGMQVMSKVGLEFGEHKGLGLLNNRCKDLQDFTETRIRTPNVGWHQIQTNEKHVSKGELFYGVKPLDTFYFIHGYALDQRNDGIIGRSSYGSVMFGSAAKFKNYFGVQFHPEKSRAPGLRVLKNFSEMH